MTWNVISGDFNQKVNTKPTAEAVINSLLDDVDLSDYSDIVLLLGREDGEIITVSNLSAAEVNLELDRLKAGLL